VSVPPRALNHRMQQDRGQIFVFDTANPGRVRTLRGHPGPVLSLAFVARDGGRPLLVSAAQEWKQGADDPVGGVLLWDVAGGRVLKEYPDELPDPKDPKPGLAGWAAGERGRAQVALAWGDGRLRLWDVDQDRVRTAADGALNDTVAYLPDRGLMLTGGWVRKSGAGRLQVWQVAAGDAPRADKLRVVFAPARDKTGPTTVRLPRALAVFAGTAAVVVRSNPGDGGTNTYRLQLVSLAEAAGKSRVRATTPLWTGGARLPVLAAAPDGRHVAVAGERDNSIRVYPTAGLLAGKKG
jgi:WD40 repeat protein